MSAEIVKVSDGWSVHFQTMDELVRFCQSPKPVHRGNCSSRNGDKYFTHTYTWDEAVTLATKGWTRGVENARKYSGRLFNVVASQIEQPRYLYDVEGLDFDVARVLSGEPEVWLEEHPKKSSAPGRIITIVYNIGCSGGINASTIEARGAVATALVELLEFGGYSVELIARADTEGHGKIFHQKVTVKRAGQPLDLTEVAFVLGHPSMLRRFLFSVREHGPADLLHALNVGSGYGMSTSTREGKARGDIYLDRMMWGESDWENPKSAEQWIMRNLKEQGIDVEVEK